MAGKLDARAKLLTVFIAVVVLSTTPPEAWRVAAAHLALAVIVVVFSGATGRAILGRITLGLPFVLMAALLMWLGSGWERGATIALKGTSALLLLAALVATTGVSPLVWAIRKLGAPKSINLIAAMMLRYIEMLSDEFSRMSRARAARCGAPLSGVALFEVHGNQAGLLLVRSWERAERIHSAMLSRGFSGEMPETTSSRFGPADFSVVIVGTAVFAAVRLLLD